MRDGGTTRKAQPVLFDATDKVRHPLQYRRIYAGRSCPGSRAFLRTPPTYEQDHFSTVRQSVLYFSDFGRALGPHAIVNIQSCPLPSASLHIYPALPARWNGGIVWWNSATLLRLSGGDADASHSIRIAGTFDSIECECQSVIRNDKGRNTS